jgi:surface polysaccharide O-acyltransferase-like enzyme
MNLIEDVSVPQITLAPVNEARRSDSPRLLHLEIIRIVAIFWVIVIHVNAANINNFSSVDPTSWWFLNSLSSLGRPAVPLFLMVSGLLLLEPGRIESLRSFAFNRLRRVVIPLIAWSAFYLVWRYFVDKDITSASQAISAVVPGQAYYHLWYLYLIIRLYVVTPILRVYIRAASRNDMRYFLLLWIVWIILNFLQLATNFHFGDQIFIATGAVGYFVLGYYLRDVQVTQRQIKLLLAVLLAAWIVTAVGTYVDTLRHDGTTSDLFYDYLSPTVVAMTIAVFLIVKQFSLQYASSVSKNTHSMIVFLGKASFGIYLVHPAVLNVLITGKLGFTLNSTSFSPVLAVPLVFTIVFLVSLAIVAVLQKIPYLRAIV